MTTAAAWVEVFRGMPSTCMAVSMSFFTRSSASNPGAVTYKHPLLEPILSVTYGVIVYQEQVIDIFRASASVMFRVPGTSLAT